MRNRNRNPFFRTVWAGGSVWYERRLRKAEVAGSNPAQSTEFANDGYLDALTSLRSHFLQKPIQVEALSWQSSFFD
jgi:hypothetical protein